MMKKFIKTICILLFLFILCSCSEKKEYKVLEITGEELTNNIFSEEEKNIIYAFYDSSDKNHKKFIEDLKTVSEKAKIDIYYTDLSHLDKASTIILFTINDLYINGNSYYAYINKKVTVSSEYKDYNTLYSDLKSIGYKSNIEIIPEEIKKSNLDDAKKLYHEGKIAESLEYLNKCWNLNEAKEFYEQNSYYNILNSWERYEYLDEKTKKIAYTNIIFQESSNQMYTITRKGTYNKDFTKPIPYGDYNLLYYYIKDDIIYTSSEENGQYKETYKINYLSDDYMTIYEYKLKKEYDYILRS